MKLQLVIAVVFVSLLTFHACAADENENDNDNCETTFTCTDDNLKQELSEIWSGLDAEAESVGDGSARKKRSSGYGYADTSYYGPYYGHDAILKDARYGGYSSGPTGSHYQGFQYRVPNPTFRKSFHEGNWHLENKHVVKNYYKKGTYEMAKKYFIALPFVKITPVTKTTSVDYVGMLKTSNNYSVRLCEHCYNGHPQIQFQALGKPYGNVYRRFNFLPETRRSRVQYGTPKIVQTGEAHISQGHETGGVFHDGHGYH